jgi:light-regulated signal transduction histidine kinase (bacteriophytochrome)
LVKALVELHGGWVALESEPGHGATFTCHLPDEAYAGAAAPELNFSGATGARPASL